MYFHPCLSYTTVYHHATETEKVELRQFISRPPPLFLSIEICNFGGGMTMKTTHLKICDVAGHSNTLRSIGTSPRTYQHRLRHAHHFQLPFAGSVEDRTAH